MPNNFDSTDPNGLRAGARRFLEMGKIEIPQDLNSTEKKDQERRDAPKLGGCGDPNCASCNPETANAPGGSPNIGTSFMRAVLQDAMRNRAFASGGFVINDGVSKPVNDDLAQARKKVDQWIVEMDGDEQSFDDIIGNEAALDQLRDAVRAPIDHAELYAAYGMKMPKGALLSGPPGCGKTMFARAAAAEMAKLYGDDVDVEMISISGSSIQSPYVGVTEGHIIDIFKYARLYKEENDHPLLVFIDEAEVLFPDRTGRTRRVAPWEESQVATFLAEMDGLQESGAFVLLATNRPEVIDQAVLRDGRCDFKITVARPNREALGEILARSFRGALTSPEIDEAMLTFAALEGLLDPHRVIVDFRTIIQAREDWFKTRKIEIDSPHMKKLKHRNFLLEHIVSGAMAVSIPARAKRYAFARDKIEGKPRGITVEDVIAAVNDVYQENKGLDHSFALGEFQQQIASEVEKELLK